METIDVVYVLGSGSVWNNNEIRFSIRSLEKNLKNFGNIYIVGEDPGFLKDVIHIPFPDTLENNADGNIIRKVLRVCSEKGLSENFLFINDDHLVLNPINAIDIPYFHKGDMREFSERYWKFNFWRKRLERTMEVLISKNTSCLHFDCHTPIVFNKTLFPTIVSQFDYAAGVGYTMKSLYGNSCKVDPVLLNGQKKTVFEHFSKEILNERLTDCGFMSFNDAGMNNALKYWLIDHFPDPSSFETDEFHDRHIDLYLGLKTDDPKVIRELFIKYGREKNLKNMVLQYDELTEAMFCKLRYKLKRYL